MQHREKTSRYSSDAADDETAPRALGVDGAAQEWTASIQSALREGDMQTIKHCLGAQISEGSAVHSCLLEAALEWEDVQLVRQLLVGGAANLTHAQATQLCSGAVRRGKLDLVTYIMENTQWGKDELVVSHTLSECVVHEQTEMRSHVFKHAAKEFPYRVGDVLSDMITTCCQQDADMPVRQLLDLKEFSCIRGKDHALNQWMRTACRLSATGVLRAVMGGPQYIGTWRTCFLECMKQCIDNMACAGETSAGETCFWHLKTFVYRLGMPDIIRKSVLYTAALAEGHGVFSKVVHLLGLVPSGAFTKRFVRVFTGVPCDASAILLRCGLQQLKHPCPSLI